ncbi:hypothetical protein B0H19DRAFT_1077825 [Mycena capillaripes]|nr:hypothetical protein B0H19DRAFT_1077825 [Mycena capillaripes]
MSTKRFAVQRAIRFHNKHKENGWRYGGGEKSLHCQTQMEFREARWNTTQRRFQRMEQIPRNVQSQAAQRPMRDCAVFEYLGSTAGNTHCDDRVSLGRNGPTATRLRRSTRFAHFFALDRQDITFQQPSGCLSLVDLCIWRRPNAVGGPCAWGSTGTKARLPLRPPRQWRRSAARIPAHPNAAGSRA